VLGLSARLSDKVFSSQQKHSLVINHMTEE
jgi:hypothetical protein